MLAVEPAERQVAAAAFSAAGVPHSSARSLVEAITAADRYGVLSDQVIAEMGEDTVARMRREFGEDAADLIVGAKRLVCELSRSWPQLRAMLNANGRGNAFQTVRAFGLVALGRDPR